MQTIEAIYQKHCAANTAISAHLPRLREWAAGSSLTVEFGVKRGASSSALLLVSKRLISYDIQPTPEALELKRVAGDAWDYRIGDSRAADFDRADVLFIDSQHDAEQCRAELDAHADKIAHRIIAHDSITFGSVGANGESGEHKWQYRRGLSCPMDALGVRIAFDELMIRDQSWRIVAHYPDSHGLLVLERQ